MIEYSLGWTRRWDNATKKNELKSPTDAIPPPHDTQEQQQQQPQQQQREETTPSADTKIPVDGHGGDRNLKNVKWNI